MAQKKIYDKEFKIQAVKLGREIGFSKAAKELGVNTDTLYGWNKRANARLKEENEFLAEASAFFAASRRKSAKI